MVSPVVRKDDTLPRGRQRPTVKKRYPRFCAARACNRPDLGAGFKRRRTSRVRFAGEREKRANARNGSVIPSKSLCAAGPNMRGHTEGAMPATAFQRDRRGPKVGRRQPSALLRRRAALSAQTV